MKEMKFLNVHGAIRKTASLSHGWFINQYVQLYLLQNSHKQFFVLSSIRLALSFDAHDSTSSIQLTAFNDTIAELFGKTIDELYSPVTNVRQKSLKSKLHKSVTLIISTLTTITLSSLNRNILYLIKTLLNPSEWNQLRYNLVQLSLYLNVVCWSGF